MISGNLTVSVSTINTNAIYAFIVDTNTIIPSGGYLTVTFPPQVTLNTIATCSYLFGFTGGAPICAVSGNVLTVTGGFPNAYGIRLTVSSVKNPQSAQFVQNFIFKFYNTLASTTPVDTSASGAFSWQFTSDTLIFANLIPKTSFVVGAYDTWRLTVTPKNPIPAGGQIKVWFPKWNIPTLFAISPLSMMTAGANTCNIVSGLGAGSLTCSFTIDPLSTNKDYLTILGAFPAIQAVGATFVIDLVNVHNMPTTRPYTTFDVFTYDSGPYAIDSQASLTVTMTTAATIPLTQVSLTVDAPTTVDATTTYLFQVFVSNPVPMGGLIRIKTPPQLGVTTLTAVIVGQRINTAVTIVPVAGSNYYVALTGGYPTTSDSVPIAGLIAFRLSTLRNPSSTATSSSFSIETYDSTYVIESITTGITVTATNGVITMNSLTFSETRVLEQNSFTFDFSLYSALQAGCSLQIVFPVEFTVTNTAAISCTMWTVSGLKSGYTCNINSNILTITAPFGAITSVGGERIQFNLPAAYVQNPTSTRPTTKGIIVRSLSQLGNVVDQYTGNAFQATVNTLTSVVISPSSMTTGDFPVTYTFTVYTPHSVEKDAIITVKFPSADITMYDEYYPLTCQNVQNVDYLTCRYSSYVLTLKNGFSSGKCTCLSAIIFYVPGVLNPRSKKPTATFEVAINTYDGYQIYQKKAGITVTMTTPNQQSTATITQTSGINGQLDNYLINYKNRNQKMDNDYMLINAPSDVQFSNTTVCAARTNVKGFYYCKYVNSQQMKVSFAYRRRQLNTVDINEGFTLLLMNVKNPASFRPSSPFTFATYTSDNYSISMINSGPVITNNMPGNFTQVQIKPTVYSDGTWTDLAFTIIPQNYQQYMTMSITIPSDVPIVAASTSVCKTLSAYSVSSNMICDYNAYTRTIKIFNAFTPISKAQYDLASTNLRQLSFQVGQFINPSGKNYSSNFTFQTYDVSGYLVDQQLTPIPYICSSLCGSCSTNDYSKCISCNTNSNYSYLYLGQCVSICPNDTVIKNGKCLVCSTLCNKCSSDSDDCLVCQDGYVQYSGSCVQVCPDGTYQTGTDCLTYGSQVNFIQYFRQNETDHCAIYAFSIATIFTFLTILVFVIINRFKLNKLRTKMVANKPQPQRRNKRQEKKQLTQEVDILEAPLRCIELSIPAISLIEFVGWLFLLICMINVQEKIPLYMLAIALLENIVLNVLMVFTIVKKKELSDPHVKSFKKNNHRWYTFIKYFSLIVSHKFYYLIYAKDIYQGKKGQFDFSYLNTITNKGFYLVSVLLVQGFVIIACIINFSNMNLNQRLYCLDIDIMVMTIIQAVLVLITLISCSWEFFSVKLLKRQDSSVTPTGKSPTKKSSQPSPRTSPGKRQHSSTTKYMKSVNVDTEMEEDYEGHKISTKLKKRNVIIENSDSQYSSHNTSAQVLLDKKKEVQKREEALKSIISGVKKRGVIMIDGFEDEEEEYLGEIENEYKSHRAPSERTLQGKKKAKRNIMDNEDEEDQETSRKRFRKRKNAAAINHDISVDEIDEMEETQNVNVKSSRNTKLKEIDNMRSSKNTRTKYAQLHNNETTLNEDNTINNTAARRRQRRGDHTLIVDDDSQQDSFRVVNTEKSHDSLHMFNQDVDKSNIKHQTQRIPREAMQQSDEESTKNQSRRQRKNKKHHQNNDDQSTMMPRVKDKLSPKGNKQKVLKNDWHVSEQSEELKQDHHKKQPKPRNLSKHFDSQEQTNARNQQLFDSQESAGNSSLDHTRNTHQLQSNQKKHLLNINNSISEESIDLEQSVPQIEDKKIKKITEIKTRQSINPHKSHIRYSKDGSQEEYIMQYDPYYSKVKQTVHGSIPTQHDEEYIIESNMPQYSQVQRSYPTQHEVMDERSNIPAYEKMEEYNMSLDEMYMNKSGPINEYMDRQNSMMLPDEEYLNKTGPYYDRVNQELSSQLGTQFNHSQPLSNQLRSNHARQPHSSGLVTDQPADYQIYDQSYKQEPSFDNHSSPKPSRTQPQKFQDTFSETNEEELRDQVNQNDIKPPPRHVIFSDKSESSVEEMMEDTPSNYNIPNGRLDEDSKGLRSILYKSIAKKILNGGLLGTQALEHGAIYKPPQTTGEMTGREDQEAQQLSRKNSEKRVTPQQLAALQGRKIDNEKEMMFVQKLIQEQEENMKGKIEVKEDNTSKTFRKASIGEFNSRALETYEQEPVQYNRNKTPMRKL